MPTSTASELTAEFVAALDAHVIKGVNDLFDALSKARRKAPIQLCPSPGCKNAAAPVFNMLCALHKDAPKAKVRAWREARRARKAR